MSLALSRCASFDTSIRRRGPLVAYSLSEAEQKSLKSGEQIHTDHFQLALAHWLCAFNPTIKAYTAGADLARITSPIAAARSMSLRWRSGRRTPLSLTLSSFPFSVHRRLRRSGYFGLRRRGERARAIKPFRGRRVAVPPLLVLSCGFGKQLQGRYPLATACRVLSLSSVSMFRSCF